MKIPLAHTPAAWPAVSGRKVQAVARSAPDDIHLEMESRWWRFETQSDGVHDCCGAAGTRGLWKLVHTTSGARLVFDFPFALCQESPGEQTDCSLETIWAWVGASRQGRLPPGWQPPTRETLAEWLPAEGLTVQHESYLRSGRLILGPEQWAVRFPISDGPVPAGLPASRAEALGRVIAQANVDWRLVRVGLVEEPDGQAAVTECDLTGAPGNAALFAACLAALRHTVAGLVETVGLITDLGITLKTLQTPRNRKA